MSAALVVGVSEKAAGDTIRLPCDFGNEPLLLQGYTITSYNVTTGGTGAPTITAKQLDYSYQVSALFAGGTAGIYDVVYTVTLNDPDNSVLSRTGSLKIY